VCTVSWLDGCRVHYNWINVCAINEWEGHELTVNGSQLSLSIGIQKHRSLNLRSTDGGWEDWLVLPNIYSGKSTPLSSRNNPM
jgi:hypothetical protein